MNVNYKVWGKNFFSFSTFDLVQIVVTGRKSHDKMPKRLTLKSVARPTKISAGYNHSYTHNFKKIYWRLQFDNVQAERRLL